jgi:hypothetical protein
MEKEFIPYEQALALKELGFDEPCLANYLSTKKLDISLWRHGFDIPAPLYQQAFRWFREKYGLSACALLKMRDSKRVSFYIINELDNRLIQSKFFKSKISNLYKTYEEAELECIKKLIEIRQSQKTSDESPDTRTFRTPSSDYNSRGQYRK